MREPVLQYQSGSKDVLTDVLDAITQTNGTLTGGRAADKDKLIEEVISLIDKDGIQRNLSILGGEPMCDENITFTIDLLKATKQKFPFITTYVWTGYTLEELQDKYNDISIFKNIDILIDGRFILEERDITLPLRGSRNQRILKKKFDF